MYENLPAEATWDQLRRQMPVAQTLAYLDHAAVAPITAPAREAVLRWGSEAAEVGDLAWPRWAARVDEDCVTRGVSNYLHSLENRYSGAGQCRKSMRKACNRSLMDQASDDWKSQLDLVPHHPATLSFLPGLETKEATD